MQEEMHLDGCRDRIMNRIIKEDMEYMYQFDREMWEKFRNKTVLVTGAYGMLPAYMVYMLIYLNEIDETFQTQIVALARNKDKLVKRFGSYVEKPYFHCYIADVCEPIHYEEPIHYIIHGASPASSQYYSTNPVGVLMPNVLGTYYTLELAKEKQVDGYLYFSSGEIYGKIEKERIYETDDGYMDPADVRSCYGEGKRVGETMCKCYSHQFHIPTCMVRPSHTYGPTMDINNDSRVFSEFVGNIARNQDIAIKSDGLASRNFCYIADATLGYFMILLSHGMGEAYNVANEAGKITIRELAELLCNMFPEKHLKAIYQKHDADYLENQHKVHSMQSTEKLKKLGWRPAFGIEEGFKRTIESFELEENTDEESKCGSSNL